MLDVPRSTIYAQQAWKIAPLLALHPLRRGPQPSVSDADLETSPFVGEGHRKVWARLRILQGIRVSKDRICRLMCENGLLSHHSESECMVAFSTFTQSVTERLASTG